MSHRSPSRRSRSPSRRSRSPSRHSQSPSRSPSRRSRSPSRRSWSPPRRVRFTDFEKDVIENLDVLRRLTDNESTDKLYKRVDRLYKDFKMLVSSGHTLDLQHKLREDIIILHLHDSDMIPKEQTLLHNIEKGLRVLYKYQLGLDFGERIIT